jgi:hypothetical protein
MYTGYRLLKKVWFEPWLCPEMSDWQEKFCDRVGHLGFSLGAAASLLPFLYCLQIAYGCNSTLLQTDLLRHRWRNDFSSGFYVAKCVILCPCSNQRGLGAHVRE